MIEAEKYSSWGKSLEKEAIERNCRPFSMLQSWRQRPGTVWKQGLFHKQGGGDREKQDILGAAVRGKLAKWVMRGGQEVSAVSIQRQKPCLLKAR